MTMPYEQAIDDRKTLMPVLSQQRLAASQQHTRCASCAQPVPVNDRAVVVVHNEPRVFHVACCDTGPIRLQLEAMTSRAHDRHRAAQAKIDAAQREVV